MNRDRLYLVHIHDAIGNILEDTRDGRDAFMASHHSRRGGAEF